MAKKTALLTPEQLTAATKDEVLANIDQHVESLKAEAAAQTAPAAKTPKVALAAIKVLVAANPKKPGSKSFPRFELYKTCKTTHEFVAAGGYSADLAWDVKHKFIALEPIAQ